MSISQLIRRLTDAGATAEVISIAVEAVEASAQEASRLRASNRERQARWRERNAARNVTNNATETLGVTLEVTQKVSPSPPIDNKTLTPPTSFQKKPIARGSRLPAEWRPNEAGRAFAVETLGSNSAARIELAKFADYWAAKAGAGGCKLDWDATWRNWVRSAAERRPATVTGGSANAAIRELQRKIADEGIVDFGPRPTLPTSLGGAAGGPAARLLPER